jgi:hypothetical protein
MTTNDDKKLIKQRALYQRIRDYLAKYHPNRRVKKAGPVFVYHEGDILLGVHEDLETLGRELKVLRGWEATIPNTLW